MTRISEEEKDALYNMFFKLRNDHLMPVSSLFQVLAMQLQCKLIRSRPLSYSSGWGCTLQGNLAKNIKSRKMHMPFTLAILTLGIYPKVIIKDAKYLFICCL